MAGRPGVTSTAEERRRKRVEAPQEIKNEFAVSVLRNYVRTKDVAHALGMSENELIDIAKEIHAFIKIRSMNYCRTDLIIDYFEAMRE